jgi:Polyketide cyclase / dehydrase and lipid transport
MRIIKLGLISIAVFALLITGISLFFPSHVRISKAIDINAPAEKVWAQVTDAAQWSKWFPRGDSLPPYIIDGVIKGIGTDSLQALMITGSTDSTVTAANVGPLAKKGGSGWNIYPGGIPNTVTVQWYMDFQLKWYPWEKFSSLLLEGRYGSFMEKGLENLKQNSEK